MIDHILHKGNWFGGGYPPRTTTEYLSRLQKDSERINVQCDSLSPVADMLRQINVTVESLSST